MPLQPWLSHGCWVLRLDPFGWKGKNDQLQCPPSPHLAFTFFKTAQDYFWLVLFPPSLWNYHGFTKLHVSYMGKSVTVNGWKHQQGHHHHRGDTHPASPRGRFVPLCPLPWWWHDSSWELPSRQSLKAQHTISPWKWSFSIQCSHLHLVTRFSFLCRHTNGQEVRKRCPRHRSLLQKMQAKTTMSIGVIAQLVLTLQAWTQSSKLT